MSGAQVQGAKSAEESFKTMAVAATQEWLRLFLSIGNAMYNCIVIDREKKLDRAKNECRSNLLGQVQVHLRHLSFAFLWLRTRKTALPTSIGDSSVR